MRQLAGALLFIAVVLGISGLGNFYILKRFFGFFELKSGPLFWILLLTLSTGLVAAMILDSAFRNPFTWVLHYLAATWFGLWFLLICLLTLYELSRLFISPPKALSGIVILAITAIISVYGFWNAKQLDLRELEFPSKVNLDLVQLSDVHFGSPNGMDFQKVINRIEEIQPDAVLITGDLVEPTSRVDDVGIQMLNQLDCPIFLTYGNHEQYTGDQRIQQLLGSTKIRILRNEAIHFKGIQIIGLDDSESLSRIRDGLSQIPVDPESYKVLMYHRPDGFQDAVQAGINLTLSGHTHNGQIWPFSWLVKIRFPKLSGLFQNDQHWLYVTPGTGNWGPPFRLGSRCEVVHIQLRKN